MQKKSITERHSAWEPTDLFNLQQLRPAWELLQAGSVQLRTEQQWATSMNSSLIAGGYLRHSMDLFPRYSPFILPRQPLTFKPFGVCQFGA